MKIRGFLLILSLLFISYLGKNIREGLEDEIEENDVFKKQTKYSRHSERQKRCLNKILNDKMSDERPVRRPTRKPKQCHNKKNKHKHNRHNKCKHLLPHHRRSHESDKYFNDDNYMLKTKMVPPVSPKGPYIKVINKIDYDEGSRRDMDESEIREIERYERKLGRREQRRMDRNRNGVDRGDNMNQYDKLSQNESGSCKACADCKNGLGFTCNKGQDYSFANMNHIPPPLTSYGKLPMTAPTSKYEPRPMLASFSAFGR